MGLGLPLIMSFNIEIKLTVVLFCFSFTTINLFRACNG